MKPLVYSIIAACVFAVPTVSFAQSDSGVTRAQVRNELIQLEKAGYNPAKANDNNYPDSIQAALARVARGEGQGTQADTSGTGSSFKGLSESGRPARGDATGQ